MIPIANMPISGRGALKKLPIFVFILCITPFSHAQNGGQPRGAGEGKHPAKLAMRVAINEHGGPHLGKDSSQDQRRSKPRVIRVILPPKDKYDYWSFRINCVLAVIGICGVVVAVCTLLKLERQTKASEDAAKAALKQAHHIASSERAWMIAEITTAGRENLLGKNPIVLPMGGLSTAMATYKLKNNGNTPAFIVEIGSALEVISEGQVLPSIPRGYDPKDIAKWTGHGVPIAPGAIIVRSVYKDVHNSMNILDGADILWVHGYVKYYDAFSGEKPLSGELRETRYCFKWQPTLAKTGIPHEFSIEGPPEYNRAT